MEYRSHVPKGTGATRGSLEMRLLNKVIVEDSNECWAWNGAKNQKGYPMIMTKAYGSSIAAHKKLVEILYDLELQSSDNVHHTCENKGCMNPMHMEIMEHGEHTRHHKSTQK